MQARVRARTAGSAVVAAAAVLLAGCAGDVRASQVEDSIRDAMERQGVTLESVDCPAGVPPRVHATITCAVDIDGTDAFGVAVDRIKVVVTAVDGSQVRYRLEPIAEGYELPDDEESTLTG